MENKTTNTIIWVSVGLALAGATGYAVWEYVLKPKSTKPSVDTDTPSSSVNTSPTSVSTQDDWTKPSNSSQSQPPAPKPKPQTNLPKLPTDWKKVSLKFPDGVPFVANVKASSINIQIPAISLNRSWFFTQAEKDTINLSLAKGASLEQVITAWMYSRKMINAAAVKNYK